MTVLDSSGQFWTLTSRALDTTGWFWMVLDGSGRFWTACDRLAILETNSATAPPGNDSG